MPTKTCERCGVEYPKDPDWSLAHWQERRFCSLKCRQGRVRTAPDKECVGCGVMFYNADHPSRPFCSQTCYWVSLRTERYPVARESRRTHNFTHKQRRLIFERDDHQCVTCGSAESLECDHIVPVWNGGTNAIDNGQTLCAPCHDEKTNNDVQSYWKSQGITVGKA